MYYFISYQSDKKSNCGQPIVKEHPLAKKSEYYCYSKIDDNVIVLKGFIWLYVNL